MSSAKAHLEDHAHLPMPGARDRASFFKTDHPRRIDRFISFFGESTAMTDPHDACGEELLEALGTERWSER